MIKKLLIANRGEIACRIIKTARKMGICTVAVYSDADAFAPHVKMADERYRIGGPAINESYLRAGRILTVAKENGVDAIHPGYGFLSENAEFAELCAAAKIKFIGPSAASIRAVALKDKAKSLMQSAGIPIVPGFHGDNQQEAFLKRKAYEIGYPVMLKAVAGNMGKGIRKVEKAIGFDEALEAVKSEALTAFGNDRILIEKLIAKPRHIEVQIFADQHGNVVHLGERDCTMQQAYQKVIEEAPAPHMSAALRATMGRAACDAAKAINYEGAGTVEFILDGENGLKLDGFYFIEMHARLQIEHPITEMITGQDLVEWQLRVASGEALPLAQEEIEFVGHAFEARIYAEDPDNGFLPSTGELIELKLPSEGVRIDSGAEKGDVISTHYDPMIAKLIVHANDRDSALTKFRHALAQSVIAGPRSNIGFLTRLANHEAFAKAQFDTGLIEQELDELILTNEIEEPVIALGVETLIRKAQEDNQSQNTLHDPWDLLDAFSGFLPREQDFFFVIDGKLEQRRLRYQGERVEILDSDKIAVKPSQSAAIVSHGKKTFVLQNGRQYSFEPYVWELSPYTAANGFESAFEGVEERFDENGEILVRMPMQGKIVQINVAIGDRVRKGSPLFVIKAAKMEHQVLAPLDGEVDGLGLALGKEFEMGEPAISLQAFL